MGNRDMYKSMAFGVGKLQDEELISNSDSH